MLKRMFSRKAPKSVSKSIRCPEEMWEAIEKLAKDAGETPNSYVVLMLDQYLQLKVEEGLVQAPGELESKVTA